MKNFTTNNYKKAVEMIAARGIDLNAAGEIAINVFAKYAAFKDYYPNVESVINEFFLYR